MARDLHAQTLVFSHDGIFHRGCRSCPANHLQSSARRLRFTADCGFGFHASLRPTDRRPDPVPGSTELLLKPSKPLECRMLTSAYLFPIFPSAHSCASHRLYGTCCSRARQNEITSSQI